MQRQAAAVLLALPLHTATAQPDEQQAITIMRSLDGSWQGALQYRDYQTDQRITIPVRADLEPSLLAPVVTRRVEFTDPGRIITSLDIATITGDTYTEFNPGDSERSDYTITGLRFDDTYDWSLTLTGRALDGGEPADIRITQTLDGKSFTVVKDVRPASDTAAEWQFRNQITLERTPADPDQLLGAWRIDLRPSAEADPYTVIMNIESIDEGRITGTFYNGSPISDGLVSTSWGVTRFAFTTSDGTGQYDTTGTLRNGILKGTTRSRGRDFLMEWNGTAEPATESTDKED